MLQKEINKTNNTQITNLDFSDFFASISSRFLENDFIFLDPPYDCVFSDYANNKFVAEQQKQLADILINHTKCKWRVAISKTDLIEELYCNKSGISVIEYDKRYSVNIKNRFNANISHFIIKDY